MTPEMWITLAILVVAIVLFVTEWLRVDVVALIVVVALILSGVLTTREAIAGFSSTVVLLIASLFIVGGAVLNTGLASAIGRTILRVAGTGQVRLIAVVLIAVAIMSGFMSDTGVVAVMMPAIVSLAAAAGISPSRLLIPLAYGALLGGASTLIGTPPNIIVSDLLARTEGYSPFSFFDYTPLAILLVIAGTIFMLTIGRRLLPDRKREVDEQAVATPGELFERYALPDSIYKLRVRKASELIGRTISDAALGHDYDIDIIEISRHAPERTLAAIGGQRIVLQNRQNVPIHPRPDTVLERDDVLLVRGTGEAVGRAAANHNLMILPRGTNSETEIINRQVGVAEVIIPPRSSLIDKTLGDVRFGSRYRLTVLDIVRPEGRTSAVRDTRLRNGDTLLVQGEWRDIVALRKMRRDFVLMDEEGIASHVYNTAKAPITGAILFGMMIMMVFGESLGLGATPAAMVAALLIILTGCLTMDEAYDAIDWKSLVLIAGMLPMSTALEKVGLVSMIADGFALTLGELGPVFVLGGLFLLTSAFTQVLSNTATAVLIAPIALATAINLDVAPQAFLMAVAVAASMAFATPVASPVNTLVMGAGNYRFSDYLKIGIPMILVTFIVSVIALPILFPF